MIFRTITDESTGAAKSIGLLGKSLSELKTIFSSVKVNGIINTFFNTSTIDKKAVIEYNAEIEKAIANDATMAEKQQIMKSAMEGTNKSTAQLIGSTKGATVETEALTVAQKSSTLAAKANQVVLKGLSIAMNVAANVGLSILISKIAEAFTANERLLSSAKELGETFLQEQSSIEDYKNRINDLQNTINDSSSSFDDVTQARKDLMVIQDELIKKYGTEEETVAKITEAINGQSDALDLLTRKQYLQWKNDFNDKDFGEKLHDFFWKDFTPFYDKLLLDFDLSGAWDEFFSNGESNISKMVSAMQHSYYTLEKTGNDALDSLIAKTYNLNGNASNFVLHGNLNDVYETLIEIQELASDFQVSSSFETSAEKLANRMYKTLQSYKDSYDTYVLYEKILDNSKNNQYDEQFDLINKAKEKFDEASILGDTEKIKEATEEYAQTLHYAIKLATDNQDQDVADYFKSMYPELQQTFGEWEFSFNFEPNTDGLKDRINNALDLIDGTSDGIAAFSIEDIESFNFDTATQEQIDAYGDLSNAADSYSLTIKQLLSLLQTMGLIQSESYKQLVDTFGQENVDKLLPDELKIAYSIDNISDMTFDELQAEIEKKKEIAEKSQTLFTRLTNSSDSLDKFQSSVKSAADAYATLLSGNYSSTELLDSIQAINQSVGDMGKSLNWEAIAGLPNSLEQLGSSMEYVSRKYAESILSDAGIDVNSDFGKMLSDTISQMYNEAKFTGMNAQLDNLQSSYQTLTGILESYNETGHISLDNLQSLLTADENLIAMLEVENGQLVINQESYENLVAAQLLEFKAKLNDAAAAEIEALAKEKSEEATNNNAKASEDAVAKLDAETEAFKRNTEAVGENAITKAIEDAKDEGVSEEEIQRVLDKYTEIWNAAMDNYSTDFPGFMNGAKSSGEAAGKSAGEAFTDALDKELAALDKKMEAGYIDFNDYIQSRLSLIEDYYNRGKLSADEYYSYLEKHYDTQLSYMDKAVNAVTRRIDTELDALKQQKEDVESLYNVQIESLEKEKTLLEAANKERQRQKDLQNALYDLERAKNQRTKLVYSEDKGMQYVADDQSVRDAQENVDSARYDIQLSKIDKSISNLEEARDKETNAIDEMISSLESYKDAWSDVTSAYEVEQENLFAAQILGADWEADILNGRLDVLNDFKDQYIRIQQEIADIGSNPDASKINFTEYASGTNNAKKGLNLVGEDGTEAYFDNHGHVAIVTKPTLIPMEGGEVVKNERDTKKLLDPDNLAPVDTIELADIDRKEALPDGRTWIPISQEEYIRKLLQIAPAVSKQVQTKQIYPETDLLQGPEKCAATIEQSLESMMNPMNIIVHNMQELTGMGTHMNHINNVSSLANNTRNAQPVINGGINVTCPGVTSKEVAKQLPGVLNEALEREFSGLHLQAMQWVK